jgi:hypothetical protein
VEVGSVRAAHPCAPGNVHPRECLGNRGPCEAPTVPVDGHPAGTENEPTGTAKSPPPKSARSVITHGRLAVSVVCTSGEFWTPIDFEGATDSGRAATASVGARVANGTVRVKVPTSRPPRGKARRVIGFVRGSLFREFAGKGRSFPSRVANAVAGVEGQGIQTRHGWNEEGGYIPDPAASGSCPHASGLC